MGALAKDRIIVALDVPTERAAVDLVIALRDHVGLFKVGLELLTSEGIQVVRKITDLGGNVFLDGKFNDIPNTVAGASRGATRMGIRMFNVHTMGGMDMMKAALKAAAAESSELEIQRPLILGVTLLTSIDQNILNAQLRIPGDIESQVVQLTRLAEEAGLDGVIASPKEIEAILRNVSRQMIIVTPGVRPVWASPQDQRRVMTPGEAIARGATYVVVGRPITKPPAEVGNPVDAVHRIADEIANALTSK